MTNQYEVTFEAPEFHKAKGRRAKTALRLAIEEMPEGSWINTKLKVKMKKGKTRSYNATAGYVRQIATNVERQYPGRKFTVRVSSDNIIWIGRLENVKTEV